jgi:hypothetical protein
MMTLVYLVHDAMRPHGWPGVSSAGFAGATLGGRFGRGAEPPSESSYRDVKHYKRRKRWLS